MTARERVIDALRDVYDPCCADRGISVVDMGLVEDVRVDGAHVSVDIVLTTGWCPFVASMSDMIPARLHDLDGVEASTSRWSGTRSGRPSGCPTRPARSSRCPWRSCCRTASGALPQPRRRLTMATTETAAEAAGARERKVPAFVFDCVCHLQLRQAQRARPARRDVRRAPLRLQFLTQAGETVLGRDEFFREWSVDEIYEMVIEGSDTDMIVAQPLPLTDLFHDGLPPWEKCAEMAAKHPDRAVFWGSVNPLEGKKALDLAPARWRTTARRRSSSTTSATTTGSRSPGAWTTPGSRSRSSSTPRSSA